MPSIKVLAQEKTFKTIGQLDCYFDPDNWVIIVDKMATEMDVKHEFHHYLVAVLRRAATLEEAMSNLFATH